MHCIIGGSRNKFKKSILHYLWYYLVTIFSPSVKREFTNGKILSVSWLIAIFFLSYQWSADICAIMAKNNPPTYIDSWDDLLNYPNLKIKFIAPNKSEKALKENYFPTEPYKTEFGLKRFEIMPEEEIKQYDVLIDFFINISRGQYTLMAENSLIKHSVIRLKEMQVDLGPIHISSVGGQTDPYFLYFSHKSDEEFYNSINKL